MTYIITIVDFSNSTFFPFNPNNQIQVIQPRMIPYSGPANIGMLIKEQLFWGSWAEKQAAPSQSRHTAGCAETQEVSVAAMFRYTFQMYYPRISLFFSLPRLCALVMIFLGIQKFSFEFAGISSDNCKQQKMGKCQKESQSLGGSTFHSWYQNLQDINVGFFFLLSFFM